MNQLNNLDDTPVYAQRPDGTIALLGRFSNEEAVYAAVKEQYSEHIGTINLFANIGSHTLPQPFDSYTDDKRELVDRVVDVLNRSEHVASAAPAQPGGGHHVSRCGIQFKLSAQHYDFTVTRTPAEPDVDGGPREVFEAIARREGIADDVEFVAYETYVPRRGAQHNNLRLYGRVVTDADAPVFSARRAVATADRVLDAFVNYGDADYDVKWIAPDGELHISPDRYDLFAVIDEPREPVMRGDVDDYDYHTTASTPFEYDEIAEWAEAVAAAARTDCQSVEFVQPGIHMTRLDDDTREVPVLALRAD